MEQDFTTPEAPASPRSRTPLVALIALLAVGSLAAAFVLPARRERKRLLFRETCQSNLRQVGAAMDAYLRTSDRRWPWIAKMVSTPLQDPPWPGMRRVLDPFNPAGGEIFHCPADERTLDADSPLRAKFPTKTSYFETEGASYEWLLGPVYAGKPVGAESLMTRALTGGRPADTPIMWDFEPFHGARGAPGSLNILYADMKVRADDYKQRASR